MDDLGEVHRELFALQRALAAHFAPESEGGAGIDLIATPAMPTTPFRPFYLFCLTSECHSVSPCPIYTDYYV